MIDFTKYEATKKIKPLTNQPKPTDPRQAEDAAKAAATQGLMDTPGLEAASRVGKFMANAAGINLGVGAPLDLERAQKGGEYMWETFKGGIERVGEGAVNLSSAIAGAATGEMTGVEAATEAGRGLMKIGSGGIEAYYSPFAAPIGYFEPEIKNSIEFIAEHSPEKLKELVNEGYINYQNLPEDTKEVIRTTGAIIMAEAGTNIRPAGKAVATTLTQAGGKIESAASKTGAAIKSGSEAVAAGVKEGLAGAGKTTVDAIAARKPGVQKIISDVATNLELRLGKQKVDFAKSLVEPKYTAKMKKELMANVGKDGVSTIESGVLSPNYVHSPREIEIAKDLAGLKIKPTTLGGDNLIYNQSVVNAAIKDTSQALKPKMAKVTITDDAVDAALSAKLEDALSSKQTIFGGDKSYEKAYKAVMDRFKTNLRGAEKPYVFGEHGGDKVWNARIKLDNAIEAEMKNAFGEGVNTVKSQALRDVRDAVNDLLTENGALLDIDFAQEMRTLSNYYKGADVIATKADLVFKNVLDKALGSITKLTKSRYLTGTLLGGGAIGAGFAMSAPLAIGLAGAGALGVGGYALLKNYKQILFKVLSKMEKGLEGASGAERAALLKDTGILKDLDNQIDILHDTYKQNGLIDIQAKKPEVVNLNKPTGTMNDVVTGKPDVIDLSGKKNLTTPEGPVTDVPIQASPNPAEAAAVEAGMVAEAATAPITKTAKQLMKAKNSTLSKAELIMKRDLMRKANAAAQDLDKIQKLIDKMEDGADSAFLEITSK